jgi:hypothetical protein
MSSSAREVNPLLCWLSAGDAEGEATISFMRKKNERFVFPEAEEVASLDFSDILLSIPKPFPVEEPTECIKAFTLNLIFHHTICIDQASL